MQIGQRECNNEYVQDLFVFVIFSMIIIQRHYVLSNLPYVAFLPPVSFDII